MKKHSKCKTIIRISFAVFIICVSVFFSATPAFALAIYNINDKVLEDKGDWDLGLVGATDVAVNPYKMGFADAYTNGRITYDHDEFTVHKRKGNYGYYRASLDDDDKYTIGWEGPKGDGKISAGTEYDIPGSIKFVFPEAAFGVSGAKYDVHLTVSNMSVIIKHDVTHGIPLMSGGTSGFSFIAYSYVADGNYDNASGWITGTSFKASIALKKAGTNTSIGNGYKMVWGFNDVDIYDHINNGGDYYDGKVDGSGSYSRWAEHVVLYNNKDDDVATEKNRFYSPIYFSKNSELRAINRKNNPDDVIVYHEGSKAEVENNLTRKADFLVRVNPNKFIFGWRGSRCGTKLIQLAGSLYNADSFVYKGSDTSDVKHNERIKVQKNSQDITFKHVIKHLNVGPKYDDESYYIKANSNSGDDVGSSSSPKSYNSQKDTEKTVYNKTHTIDLAPGESKIARQTIYFQLSNINDKFGAYNEKVCTLGDLNAAGSVCTQLYRPVAKFKGYVYPSITSGAGSSPIVTDDGTKIVSTDGRYTVKFTADIVRNASTGNDADEAGGTATANWHIKQTLQGEEISGSRQPSADATPTYNKTAALSNGGTAHVVTSGDNYTYTGHLRYGEQHEVCAALRYNSVVDKANGNTSVWKTECVKVWREPKPCRMDTSNKFGIRNGENLGAIGVKNSTLSPTGGYRYTPSSPSSFISGNSYTVNRDIWARPGDSIRFIQETCAGGAYAVSNSSLNKTTYKSTYTTSGELSGSNSEGYLFGDALPTRKSSDPLRYNKSRSWDSSTSASGTFMSGDEDDAEFSLESPSSSGSGGYRSDTYKCSNSNSAFEANHYQIKGDASDDGCNAKTMTGISSDVGKTITQSLTWNHVKVTNGSVNTSGNAYKQNYTAKANVKIPYNYVIQPSISNTNNEGKKVVYLGATAKFGVDLHVMPRHNITVSTDSTKNNYATITKPTSVVVKYYFKGIKVVSTYWGTREEEDTWGEQVISTNVKSGSTDKRIRLNTKGNLNGTPANSGGTATNVADGGYIFKNFDVVLDDSSVDVGNQVCAEVSVWPADSHDSYPNNYELNNTVEGAGSGDTALKEDGSSTKLIRTTCYTIAKKPTISVESANAYAGGDNGFLTSRYGKQFSVYNSITRKYEPVNDTFGSWSEYGVFGRVAIKGGRGIASGATFGYATGSNNVAINGARSNSGSVARDLDGINCSDTTVFSTQTFPNINCDATNGSIGKAGIGKDQATHFRDRIRDRFYSPSSTKESEPNKEAKKRCMSETYMWNNNSCRGDDTSHGYKYFSGISAYGKVRIGNSDYMNMDNFINSKFDENGVNHTYFRSNAYLGRGSSFLTLYASHNFGNNQEYIDPDTGKKYPNRNFTRLIQVTNDQHNATLIIDSDIRVGNYEATNETAKNNPVLHNTGEIVQFVIIADKVKITSRVNQIDAIIIADEVDTCAYDSVSDMAQDIRVVLGSADFDANTCNSQLLFRAPVLTKKLTLNRTYGANNGTESIKRAEIFDLNPYTYLWSYGQMSRYSQAVTTYSREMPSRY